MVRLIKEVKRFILYVDCIGSRKQLLSMPKKNIFVGGCYLGNHFNKYKSNIKAKIICFFPLSLTSLSSLSSLLYLPESVATYISILFEGAKLSTLLILEPCPPKLSGHGTCRSLTFIISKLTICAYNSHLFKLTPANL